MPLIYLPPDPPPPPPRTWPNVPANPAKRIVWVSPDGVEFALTDSASYTSTLGRSGFGRVEPDLVADATGSGATLLRDYRDTPRVMSVPLTVQGVDPDTYLASWRALVASTRHRRPGRDVAHGTIRVELPDGSRREIAAVYQGGLEMVESELDDLMWSRSTHPNVEFYAPDPYFLGPPIRMAWQLAADPKPFYPIYPLRVAPSRVGGSSTIVSPGDADSYAVWQVTGPGTPVVTNADTGETWAFTAEVPAGETVTVDCRPPDIAPDSGLTATDQDGVDWWQHFAGFPELWSIPPGTSTLTVAMVGATSASRLRLEFRPRYLAGW